MKRTNYKTVLDTITQEVKSIADHKIQSLFTSLLNLVESLVADNDQLRTENQALRDENNHLKGEQGKPTIRKQTSQNISSEAERKKRSKSKKKKEKAKKQHKVPIDRVEFCRIDKEQLPADAIFKGYKPVIVQDVMIKTDNIQFKKEMYYSPSQNKTFLAGLPDGYTGEFGPSIKALIISLYHDLKMTEWNIYKFFITHGVQISTGSISNFLIKGKEEFHQEKQSIINAGLSSTYYQQMDETRARVSGKNHYVHVLCNEFYSAYFTRPQKNRLTVIEVLAQAQLQFVFNPIAFALMEEMHLPINVLNKVKLLYAGKAMNRQEIKTALLTVFPATSKKSNHQQIILEATAIAAYRMLPHATRCLLTDDASVYDKITTHHPLCWIHEGRHYKKLDPMSDLHRKKLKYFLTQFWDYYDKLLDYKDFPTAKASTLLSAKFDKLFSTKTGFEQLDERIVKTKAKKQQLLLVLSYPEIPLHNNGSELCVRDQARRRDISFHTMSQEGTAVKDTFMTLAQTARKLSVNFYHYIFDRISRKYVVPSLAFLITQRANNLA